MMNIMPSILKNKVKKLYFFYKKNRIDIKPATLKNY